MQQNSRRTPGGRNWTRQSLVIVEVGLALVLLVGAGLLLRSLQRLFSIAPGFDPARLLTMQVHVSGRRFDDDAATLRFFAQALEAVRQTPGVTQAAFTSLLPLSGDSLGQFGIQFQGEENRETVFRYVVSPGFCETMGIPLLRGRQLDDRDVTGAPLAVVISESLARAKFPGKDPIGQRLRAGPPNRAWSSVVGVVGDVRQASLVESDPNAVYLTPEQSWFADTEMSLVVRGRGDVSALVPAIKSAIWSVDKDQPIVRVAMMDALLTATASERRFAMIVFEAFALVALLLAATGLYGVLSGSVTERTREIGVRAALGASRADILGLVVRQGMTLTGVGVAIGLGGAVLASRALITLLFRVSRLDLATYAGVVGLLLAVSALACWVPAWRASRVDPATTLRAE
jgi:putative ABC transport system permease protein